MTGGYLLVLDFDGNVANTFAQSPNGIGVNEAYQGAIETIFGKHGLEVYRQLGGLKNRAPEELIGLILRECSNSENFLNSAKKCLANKCAKLEGLVPEGKGASMVWSRNNSERICTIAEMLVRLKLNILLEEICSDWPLACKDFVSFISVVNKIKDTGINVSLAILSSGHDKFIKKTFSTWGIDMPAVMVTDDDMRGRTYPKKTKDRVKPSPFLFDLVQSRWQGIELTNQTELAIEARGRMMYFGDDPNKDGLLAKNSGVPFGLYDPDNHHSGTEKTYSCNPDIVLSIFFDSWKDVADLIASPKALNCFQAGDPIHKIISDF